MNFYTEPPCRCGHCLVHMTLNPVEGNLMLKSSEGALPRDPGSQRLSSNSSVFLPVFVPFFTKTIDKVRASENRDVITRFLMAFRHLAGKHLHAVVGGVDFAAEDFLLMFTVLKMALTAYIQIALVSGTGSVRVNVNGFHSGSRTLCFMGYQM